MINNANKYTISDIFSAESFIKYVIPKFQREYSWNKENWEELFNDVFDGDGGHFIGSIICINGGADTLRPELELIDGQQRLTTISLLFSAIYTLLLNKAGDDDESKLELGNLRFRLINKQDRSIPKIELSRQNNNQSDYLSVLNEVGIIEFNEDVRNRGNRRIFKAYRYFLARLESLSIEKLLSFLQKINGTLLVKIEVSSHSDAFMLFESLNNRGVPLSAIDLIKNKILAQVDEGGAMTIDEAFAKWNKIIRNLEDYPIQERFLRQFYNAFKYKKEIRVEGVSKATRSTLIRVYETLIERNVQNIFNELSEKSNFYRELIAPQESEDEMFITLRAELLDLIHVQAAPAYAFLLFIFSSSPNKEVAFYKELIDLLVKYFIRRNITDFPNTRNLDQIFMNLIEHLNSDMGDYTIEFISGYLTDDEHLATMEQFERELGGDLYEANVDATRFILSKIEEQKKTNEIHVDFWERQDSKLIWTIEHIFPEGKNIPDEWIDMMAGGDSAIAEKIQEDYVHKLGNLTLTGYNQYLSNFDFTKKRDRKDSRGNYIGYKNKLFLNDDLANRESWTKEDIIKRTEKLIQIAKDIFSIGGK